MLKAIIHFLFSFILKRYATKIQQSIIDVDPLEISNTSKSIKIAEEIKSLKANWPNWAINLVIELGVAYLRLKQGEKIE